MGRGHHGLKHVDGVVHAAGDGNVGFDLVVEDGSPVKPEAQLMWTAEDQVRYHLQLLEVEVGLIEAIEDDDAVGARFGKLAGEVRTRGEVRAKLHRDGNAHVLADGAHQIAVTFLELFSGDVGSVGTSKMFSSSASAPACTGDQLWQPPPSGS